MEQNIVFVIAVVICALVVGSISIAVYVLRALGLYKLAKNSQIRNPWLAWMPVGDTYIMGSLARNSPFVKRKFPNIHIILPSIIGAYVIFYIAFMIYFFSIVPLGMASNMFSFTPFVIFYILFMLFALFMAAAYYFVLYHVYKSYDSNNTVLYTVLSIIFRLDFVFLFVIRNKKTVYLQEDD